MTNYIAIMSDHISIRGPGDFLWKRRTLPTARQWAEIDLLITTFNGNDPGPTVARIVFDALFPEADA